MNKITFLSFFFSVFIFGVVQSQNGDDIFVENIEGVDYVVHKFTTTGSSSFEAPNGISEIDVLVIGGGGAGIENTSFTNGAGGGGGAGGYIYRENFDISSLVSPIDVTVGAGGIKRSSSTGVGTASNGQNSNFANLTALGGGGGAITAENGSNRGGNGGSGGGARNSGLFGDGLQPDSTSGGLGNPGASTPNASTGSGAGGGGGAGSAGFAGTSGTSGIGGNGGAGVQNNIDGTNRFYAAGGGAGGPQGRTRGLGGSGIGGDGANNNNDATDGEVNTGSGGGGGNNSRVAGNGGSGIIIIRYRLDDVTDFVFVNDGDYEVNTNWLNNTQPSSGDNVIIAADPNLLSNQTVNNVSIFSGINVNIGIGNSFNIEGDISNSGQFTGEGEVVLNGSSQQSISGGGSFENLRLNNSTSVVFNDPSDLFGNLYVDQGTLNTGGNLSLRCDFGTGKAAQVAPVLGAIVGEVTVEQCYPARRAFRFLTSSVNTSTSIRENWQDNPDDYLDIPRLGYGTHITGVEPGPANAGTGQDGDDGFDYSPSGNASMFTFNNTDPSWNRVQSTLDNDLVAGVPYRLMIRGDRSIDITSNSSPPTATRLSATGNLATGTQTFTNLSTTGGNFNFIGNPYQAQVDIGALLTSSSNLSTTEYYVWDPTLGGAATPGSPGGRGAYVTVDPSDGSSSFDTSIGGLSSSTANQYLQPMQGAFVVTQADGSASLTFEESMKAVEETQTEVKSLSESEYINIQLFDAASYEEGNTPSDGLRIKFDKSYSITTEDDSPKLGNLDENLARIEGNIYSAIERRPFPESEEKLELFINQYRREAYVMKFDLTDNLNTKVYIEDKYLEEVTEITSSANTYTFTVDESIPESKASDRFALVFEPVSLSTPEETITSLSLYPNPTQGNFSISGRDLEQGAELEIYNMIGQQVYKSSLKGQSTIEVTDFNATTGIYLVKLKTNQGEKTFKLIKE
ncbi:T9SS type A sorting domain-containing protein [Psychroflexus montanilacus]|uniref:T9SS type A sorting domain-containing protein n=1 Tax=Psychroflexus montanilacus TaxID=2873598 RepID=UPI001CD03356|nr:T9SS type A sorting domain-containing protein [Psychroflexus montanilacus]MBZ9652523.1 T9SS type A sorting domain-containing protein [Psychroflexus montanilacus]